MSLFYLVATRPSPFSLSFMKTQMVLFSLRLQVPFSFFLFPEHAGQPRLRPARLADNPSSPPLLDLFLFDRRRDGPTLFHFLDIRAPAAPIIPPCIESFHSLPLAFIPLPLFKAGVFSGLSESYGNTFLPVSLDFSRSSSRPGFCLFPSSPFRRAPLNFFNPLFPTRRALYPGPLPSRRNEQNSLFFSVFCSLS